jgi:histone arginine demethylase JMJD6
MEEWKEKLDKAKKLHRPSLKDWTCDGFYERFPSYVRMIESKHSQYESFAPSDGQINYFPDLPIVVDVNTVSRRQFARKIEEKNLPAIIRRIPVSDEWEACEKWKLENLQNDEELCERRFKCGEDDDGHSIKVKLKHFFSYMHANRDDSPLYIFDDSFDLDPVSAKLLDHYRVPSYFEQDLFHLVGDRRRPPHRWFLIGPERSGGKILTFSLLLASSRIHVYTSNDFAFFGFSATVHIDPLGTSAWNTLLCGKKRWILFPPNVPKSIVKGKEVIGRHEDDEPVHYFTTIFPRTKQRAVEMLTKERRNGISRNIDDVEKWKKFTCCYEFTQMTGDTVFIPNGWWHAVLNLTHTVAVTQNFCSCANFDEVWLKTRTGRKKMAGKWFSQLEKNFPQLAQRALELNRRDGFVMTYNPVLALEQNDLTEKQPQREHKNHRSEKGEKQSYRGKKGKRKYKELRDQESIDGINRKHEIDTITPPSKIKRKNEKSCR